MVRAGIEVGVVLARWSLVGDEGLGSGETEGAGEGEGCGASWVGKCGSGSGSVPG